MLGWMVQGGGLDGPRCLTSLVWGSYTHLAGVGAAAGLARAHHVAGDGAGVDTPALLL